MNTFSSKDFIEELYKVNKVFNYNEKMDIEVVDEHLKESLMLSYLVVYIKLLEWLYDSKKYPNNIPEIILDYFTGVRKSIEEVLSADIKSLKMTDNISILKIRKTESILPFVLKSISMDYSDYLNFKDCSHFEMLRLIIDFIIEKKLKEC